MVNITDIDGKVTKAALDALEVHIDNVFNKLGIDVGFTHHFLDRVNDERNGKQITIRELGRLFAKEYKRWGKPIAQMGPDKEAIMKDLESDVNIPFVLKWNRKTNQLDLVAKTVMRKKNFKSPDREFPVESANQVRGSEPLPKNSKPSKTGSQPHPYKGRLVGEAEITEDLGSIPPLTDLVAMAIAGQTTVAVLKAAFKTGKNMWKLKRLADRAGVKLANKIYHESNDIAEDRITQVNVEDNWSPGNIGKDMLMYSGVSLIGTLGPINLYQKKIGVMNRSIFITTTQLSKESSDPVIIEGELLLTQNYTEDSVTLWQIKGAALGKNLRGKKLMPKIYAYLVKKGFFLRSDTDQSKGGMKIWAELAKIPGITVYAAREDVHGKMDYTAVDGDEVLAGDFPIYRNEGVDEYTNEIKAARSQYNVLLAQSEKVSDPQQLEKMQSDLDFLDNHIRKLTKERDEIYNDDRLSRQKNELIYLLATADKKPKNESINEVSSVELPKSWGWIGNTDWEGKNTKYVKKLGRLGGFDVVLEQYGANSRKVFLVTDKNENSALDRKPISLIEFERDYGNREGMEYWIAKATIIHPSWQGKGIAPKLYAFLCKKGWVIRSDDLQSQGGKKIWIALSKIPGITVYAAKNDGGDWELSDIDNDVDDFLRSGFHTYDTELKNEVKEIERELAFVEDKIREVWDDYSNIDKTDTATLARLKKEYTDLRTMEKKLRDEKLDAQSKQNWNEEHEDVYLFAHAAHDPMYDKPKIAKTESVKKNEKMTENTGNIKINPVSVSDHYKGETFGSKYLTVDGVIKAGVDVSIYGDEVYISHVITAEDSRRKGYAKMVVDDLFKEFPGKKISVSNMTDDGSAFFRSQYNIDDENGEIHKKLGEEIETVRVSKDWKSYMWGFPIKKYYSRFTEVEPMGKFRVFIDKDRNVIDALLCDQETNMHALVHMSRRSAKSPCVIHAAALDPALQGKGLMPKFYAHLVTKVGLFLQADSMQSAGGRKVWVALSKDPTVTVFTAYKENGVEKYSHVEGDNLLYSDAPIYDDERDENVAEIKNEINSIQNLIDDYTATLRAEVNRADPNEEKIKELQSHIRELTPKKEELKKEYLEVLPKKPKKTFSKLLAVPAKTPTPESVNETIKKVKGGFQLRSKDGKKNLGTYPTKAGALKRERQVQYFKHMNESYKLQLERDDNLYVLHILNTNSGKRTEVRGKANYETNGYDANDKLHQLLDTIGKSANISELMNGEVVTINPKHPQGEIAKKATDVAFNEDAIEPDPTGYQHDLLTMPPNTLVIDTSGDLDWYKLGQHFARLNQQDPHEFGQGASDMVITLSNREQVDRVKRILDKFGAEYKEIGGSPEHPEIHSESELKELKIVKPHPDDTLGVPRRHMPQIDEKHYEDLFRYIYDNGGKIKKETVDPADLMSTQSEFSDKGVEAAMTNGKMNKPIIISSDNYVLDGHHRWLAAKNAKIHKITAFKLNRPAKEGLSLLINFPQTTFKDIHEAFNSPLEWEWVTTRDDLYKAIGYIGDNRRLIITIEEQEKPDEWEVMFTSTDKSGGQSTRVTNMGSEFQIFSTIVAALQDWWGTHKDLADVIKFTSWMQEKSRVKLYNTLAKRMASMTGFHLDISKEGSLITFALHRYGMNESAGVGKIVKGVNTTIDVGPNEIAIQAAKFGNKVSKNGVPAKMLTEAQLQEAMLDSVTKWLGSKAQNTIDDLSQTILTMKDAAILIKDILTDENYFQSSYTQMVKSARGMLKQLSSVLNTAIGIVNNETVSTTLKDMVQNIVTFASAIFKRGGIIGFLGSLGVYAFSKYMVQNLNSAKTILANVVKSNFADQFGTFISTVMNVATEKVPGLTFFSFFDNLNAVKELFFEVLSSIKRKLEFGRNLNTKAA